MQSLIIKTSHVSDKMKRKNPVMTTEEVKATNPKKAVKYDVQDWEEDLEEPKSPPGTLESIVDIAQREYREEQPGADLELEEDFFCGSVGSAISTLPPESLNNNNLIPRSRIVQANWDQAEIPNFVEDSHMADLMTSQRWHDYLDMNKKYTTNNPRSEPISITDKH